MTTTRNPIRIRRSLVFVGLFCLLSIAHGEETTHNARTVRFFPVDKGFHVSGLLAPDGTPRAILLDPIMPEWSDSRDRYAYLYHRPFEGVTTYVGHIWNDAGSGKPYGRDTGSSAMIRFIGPMVFGLIVERDGTAWVIERNLYEPTYSTLRVDRNGTIDRELLPPPLRDTSSIREWRDNHHPAPLVWSHGNNAVGYELSYTREGSMGLFTTAFLYPDSGTSDWASFGVQGWMPEPELLFPDDGDTLFAGEITFRWNNPSDELAIYTDLYPATGPAIRSYTNRMMKPGVYFWSVKAKSKGNGRVSYSEQRRLVIVGRPKVERVEEPNLATTPPSKNDTLERGSVVPIPEIIDTTIRGVRPDIE